MQFRHRKNEMQPRKSRIAVSAHSSHSIDPRNADGDCANMHQSPISAHAYVATTQRVDETIVQHERINCVSRSISLQLVSVNTRLHAKTQVRLVPRLACAEHANSIYIFSIIFFFIPNKSQIPPKSVFLR
jgi:hypothetical protein